jgi:hypothetical protein
MIEFNLISSQKELKKRSIDADNKKLLDRILTIKSIKNQQSSFLKKFKKEEVKEKVMSVDEKIVEAFMRQFNSIRELV